MTVNTIQKDLNMAYNNIKKAIADANRAAIKYEILMSEQEYKQKGGVIIADVDNYLLQIQNASNQNN